MNISVALKKLSKKLADNLLENFARPDYHLAGVIDIAVPPLEVMFVQSELTHELTELCVANTNQSSCEHSG